MLFRKPLYNLMDNLSRRTDTTTIRLGDFEWKVFGLDQVVLEREKLRFAIIIAAADNKFLESEIRHIANMAYSMNSNLKRLDNDKKIAVLHDGTIMAASDGLISMSEYRVLASKCKELEIQEEILFPMIRELHMTSRCDLDEELKTYLENKLSF